MRFLATALLAVILSATLSACSESVVGELSERSPEHDAVAQQQATFRHPHLLPKAVSQRGDVAGKGDGGEVSHLFLAFNTLGEDGVTRRIMDEWAVTRRIMSEYGVTRRVLDKYGLTHEVLLENEITSETLESYHLTVEALERLGAALADLPMEVTDESLKPLGSSVGELDAQGVSRRILDDYAVTRRVLDTYGLTPETLRAELEAAVPAMKLKVRIDDGVPGISVKVKNEKLDAVLNELLKDPVLKFVEPDVEMQGEPILREQDGRGMEQLVPWNMEQIGLLATEYDDSAVDVYILDSGIFAGTGSGKGSADAELNVVEQKDFTMLFDNREMDVFDDDDFEPLPYFDPGTTGDPMDYSGHGTHIAGILGAIDDKDGTIGAAPGARIHSLKVLTDDGRTDVTTVVAAIDYVVQARESSPDRPTVMNLSFGADIGTTANSVVDDAVQRAIDSGIVVVVSAGNMGAHAATFSPAHVDAAITVGAHDQSMTASSFSNFGGPVDLYAPGSSVISVTNDPADYVKKDFVLAIQSGTSMAAPHVAGAAAQFLAMNPGATPGEVQSALVSNGIEDVVDGSGTVIGTRVHLGFLRTPGDDKDFKVEAKWDKGVLKLKGEGMRGLPVDVSDESGAFLGRRYVHRNAKWEFEVTGLSSRPCSVTARHNGETLTVEPEAKGKDACANASDYVGATIVIKRLEWKADGRGKGLKVELEGVEDGPLSASFSISGEALFSSEFDKKGEYKQTFDISNPADVPCGLRFESGGEFIVGVVNGAPAGCRQ